MRSIADITHDLSAVETQLNKLKCELNEAKLAQFLRNAGVPEEDKSPIFANNKGEKLLVTSFDGSFPVGKLIKKDGSVSLVTRSIYSSCDYKYIAQCPG